eukprot:PRCOL_00000072-RA
MLCGADEVVALVRSRKPDGLDDPVVRAAVEKLLAAAENAPGVRVAAGDDGGDGGMLSIAQGTWDVVWAPHISRLSVPVGVRIDPIRYRVRGNEISSNVRLSLPLMPRPVWLSAAGTFEPRGDKECRVLFDKFWVDATPSDTVREWAPQLPTGVGPLALAERFVDQTGRAAFFPALSRFPVLYMDDRFAVFQFPPLRSNIAIVRVGENAGADEAGRGAEGAGRTPRPGAAAGVGAEEVTIAPPRDDVDMVDAAEAARSVRGQRGARATWGERVGGRTRSKARGGGASGGSAGDGAREAPVVAADEIREPTPAAQPAEPAPPAVSWESLRLSGTWQRDSARSSDDKGLLDLMDMSFAFRQAYGLLNTLEIAQSADTLRVSTRALIISLDERYPTSGAAAKQSRRDLRPGACSGRARVVPRADAAAGAAAEVKLAFEGEKAGTVTEYYYIDGAGALVREVELALREGGRFEGVTYYTRA